MKTATMDAATPSFSSAIDSVQFLGIERVQNEDFPWYKVTVKNSGKKAIVGLSVGMNDATSSNLFYPNDAPALIESGKTYSFNLSSGSNGQLIGKKYLPDTIASIQVKSAVFDDGDYVGDRDFAFLVLIQESCNRVAARRTVELLDTTLQSGATDLQELRERVLGVSEELAESDRTAFAAQYPSFADDALKGPPDLCGAMFYGYKRGLQIGIDAFEGDHGGTTADQTVDWLKTIRDTYSKRLSKLEPLHQAARR